MAGRRKYVDWNGYACYEFPRGGRGKEWVHRTVMGRYLGRDLDSWEEIHHRNRDRSDYSFDNLQYFRSHREHMRYGHGWWWV